MTLKDLIPSLPLLESRGDLGRAVRGIAYDSREVKPGYLFVAMDGLHTDGHKFVADALTRGAVAILQSQPIIDPSDQAAYLRVANPRTALSPLAAAFFDHPSRSIKVIGVTGTDGKSSTVWFITQLLELQGHPTGFLSTVSFKIADAVVKNPFRQSTPEASEIHGMMRAMVDTGREFAVVETTSHGLSARMNRLGDVAFDAAVLTNVTHEHLEFHGSFEQYRSDKANLFRSLSPDAPKAVRCPRWGILNADDPSADYFRSCTKVPVATYGFAPSAELSAEVVHADLSGTSFRLISGGKSVETRIPIPGPFWVENSLAACLTAARVLEISPLDLASSLDKLQCVQGRMDYVSQGQPFAVIVDYAHTPGAFAKLFPWARARTSGSLIVVFGSAGERDNEKRPMQGKAAADYCDIVVITDEDPRGEDRMRIIEQVAAGCAGKTRGQTLFLIPDRGEAIRHAISRAATGDTVLLLGKGHEGSIIGPAGPQPWDERAQAVAALADLGFTGP